ncbi:MFS transporter [Novosphingobium taihuense]|uniref:MFS family permease n=1 Tax=Novosphingobium taihuense TaxID=260085 RepID=A0A7W7AC02_9SPHN|nr:MFS transporter [Novosphingobium taihuense]MBB4614233.1 MFS family permease [Novosphingobium taihuense]TWH87080.1 putative MFS family arabinose efflux permease [Novosphingobium taihuense]
MTTSDPPSPRIEEWRSNWLVVVGSALGIATGMGVFSFVSSQFILPLQAEFGWSRTSQSLALNAQILAGLLAPAFGLLVDRFGARAIAAACFPLVAATYFGLAAMPNSLAAFYGLMLALPMFGMGTAGIVFSRAVLACFNQSRGLALAASRLGVAVAGVLLPIMCYGTIARFGWRGGYVLLGLLALLVGWPATRLLRRRGVSRGGNVSLSGFVQLLRNRHVLILCGAVSLTLGPIVGIIGQLQPILSGKGLALQAAAALGGVLAASIFAGTILTGALIDRVWAPLIGCLFTIAAACGCLMLSAETLSVNWAIAALALIGLGQGAEIDLAGFMIARYLGIEQLAAIFGITITAISIASALCGIAVAACYDHLATYDPALIAGAGLLVVAAILYLAMGRYPEPELEK